VTRFVLKCQGHLDLVPQVVLAPLKREVVSLHGGADRVPDFEKWRKAEFAVHVLGCNDVLAFPLELSQREGVLTLSGNVEHLLHDFQLLAADLAALDGIPCVAE
jgi:hypothetical protein